MVGATGSRALAVGSRPRADGQKSQRGNDCQRARHSTGLPYWSRHECRDTTPQEFLESTIRHRAERGKEKEPIPPSFCLLGALSKCEVAASVPAVYHRRDWSSTAIAVRTDEPVAGRFSPVVEFGVVFLRSRAAIGCPPVWPILEFIGSQPLFGRSLRIFNPGTNIHIDAP